MRTLTVPPAARRDDAAVQMVSAWIAERGLHCSLNIGMWEAEGHNEAKAWGILLADIVRHVANAVEESKGEDRAQVATAIVQSLSAELDSPTSKATGASSLVTHERSNPTLEPTSLPPLRAVKAAAQLDP